MKTRILTIFPKPSGNPDHPFINISGKWLQRSGFDIGNKVLVENKKGLIRIRPIDFPVDDGDEKEV